MAMVMAFPIELIYKNLIPSAPRIVSPGEALSIPALIVG
jgi:hypothetical protein